MKDIAEPLIPHKYFTGQHPQVWSPQQFWANGGSKLEHPANVYYRSLEHIRNNEEGFAAERAAQLLDKYDSVIFRLKGRKHGCISRC
ncbi:uncharacterized protein SPPG_03776 [Spizellomyces punctatus DAOM BR117]|uniref:Uncharacterized protein n=1 Tax=Spizellomyces punctatus (strain DAOM BR117) TaxID=645134 RepID=A0A0L0HGR8_SPIPD|nr:uncharacterized protein SPPG_03776 [Spizellomyces punctatus DAOM BR117]KND00651.1 hypothetical protein SPPG_03776 [Spizellomyces punctatus DAOM BR117]|eukprot:XP_016608690.1 hypothetical protein SPPG_03776 [Spizellomyces punctatus DAOM BR117]